MNNQSEHQKQQANQFFHCQEVASKPEKLICTTQVNIPKEVIKFDPTNFTTTIHELTLLVVALTRFGKLVLPLFPCKPKKNIPPKVKQKKG
ncbi:MAG: hypothetical protein WBG73_03205 [Coleofasciculaceae cyanobacterium]